MEIPEDRLSDLPDCLLHDILSRLKARQAVQTCVLASRWRHLWLTVPRLTIDGGEFLSPRRPDRSEDTVDPFLDVDVGILDENYYLRIRANYEEELGRFEDFVDNLLCRRSACAAAGSSLEALEFLINGVFFRSPETYYARWVRRGLKCSPAALHVAGDGCFIKLPPLASSGLKKLHLDGVVLAWDFEEQLSSALPALQDLEIRNTGVSHLKRIASPSLKNLTIYPVDDGRSLAFFLVAPRLASLRLGIHLSGHQWFGVTIVEAPCLVQASLHILGNPQQNLWGYSRLAWPEFLCKFLRSLSSVTRLDLSGFQDMIVGGFHPELLPAPVYPPLMPNYLQPVVYPLFPPPNQFYQPYHPLQQLPPVVQSNGLFFPRPMLEAILDDALPMLHGLKTLVLEECDIGHSMQTLQGFLHVAPALEKVTLKNCKCQKLPFDSSFSMVIQRGTNGKFEDVLERLGGMEYL